MVHIVMIVHLAIVAEAVETHIMVADARLQHVGCVDIVMTVVVGIVAGVVVQAV